VTPGDAMATRLTLSRLRVPLSLLLSLDAAVHEHGTLPPAMARSLRGTAPPAPAQPARWRPTSQVHSSTTLPSGSRRYAARLSSAPGKRCSCRNAGSERRGATAAS
jgi:hypothetical protein